MVRARPRSSRPTSKSAYARLVGQLFSVTGSLEQADDVVQEAFIRALDRWPRIQACDVPSRHGRP
ncbi:sigma factor [Streptomyces mirabilis]|uniref:sigma factor n=1 Tax=Streptomyces mirabilis TaxID=68239 RepID=UPI0036770373